MVRRKTSHSEKSPTGLSDHYVRMDIDIQALRAKNKVLVQNVAKLQQEKAVLQKSNTKLQEDYFKLNSKFINLKNILSTIDSTIKISFTNIANEVNHLAKIMQLCSVGATVSGLNKEPQTLTVQPHTVNGTVIKNPTITLSRFTNLNSPVSPCNTTVQPQTGERLDQSSVPNNESAPSTSGNLGESFSSFFNNSSNPNEEEEEDNLSDVVQFQRRNGFVLQSSDDEKEEEQNEMGNDEDDDVSDHTYCQRLVTINEESEDHTLNTLDQVREIRIYLSPLPVNHQTTQGPVTTNANNSNNENQVSSSRTVNFLNSSIDISLPSPSNSRFDGFGNQTIDRTKNISTDVNRPSCSFMDNISSIMRTSSMQEGDSTNSQSLEKSNIMATLGLMERTGELTTSTPVVQFERKSRRLGKKSLDTSGTLAKNSPNTSKISKRKKRNENMVPHVIIQRMSIGKTGSPIESLANVLDTEVIRSTNDLKIKTRKNVSSEELQSTPKSEKVKKRQGSVTKKTNVQKIGKENRKLLSSCQSIKSSPRPKRAARPTVLRESSLKKKMRRSR